MAVKSKQEVAWSPERFPRVGLRYERDCQKTLMTSIPAYIHKLAQREYVCIWELMQDYVVREGVKTILELGTRNGNSTRIFAEALLRTGGEIWTVDLNEPTWTKKQMRDFPNVHFVKSDVLKLEWDKKVDLVYIDDYHQRFHVFQELVKYSKVTNTIMLHDVLKIIYGRGGIIEAIEQWCYENLKAYSVYPFNNCGLAVIHV